ncbi:MAG: orotidine-5'-phosphate decarboxylase [Rickettsiales bacterium TMED289]|nr:MAG: orotidine-5'-phosphate decarboxylase [Rickettsiales bacterium TMED289]
MTVKLKPKQTIIALDVSSLEEIKGLLSIIDKDLFRLKVGKQLFTSQGPKAIDKLRSLGFDIFLDLKLHDIPNTVSKSLANICNLGVWMSNIHILGGQEMIEAASSTVKRLNSEMILLGVTILTSLNENNLVELGFNSSVEDLAINLAKLGKQNGIDGVVCSIEDISGIKAALGGDFLSVTPGVRMLQDIDDQKRAGSIYDAIRFGTDFVVVGREITQAKNPEGVLKKIESLIV